MKKQTQHAFMCVFLVFFYFGIVYTGWELTGVISPDFPLIVIIAMSGLFVIILGLFCYDILNRRANNKFLNDKPDSCVVCWVENHKIVAPIWLVAIIIKHSHRDSTATTDLWEGYVCSDHRCGWPKDAGFVRIS